MPAAEGLLLAGKRYGISGKHGARPRNSDPERGSGEWGPRRARALSMADEKASKGLGVTRLRLLGLGLDHGVEGRGDGPGGVMSVFGKSDPIPLEHSQAVGLQRRQIGSRVPEVFRRPIGRK